MKTGEEVKKVKRLVVKKRIKKQKVLRIIRR